VLLVEELRSEKDKAWTIFMPQAFKSNSHAIEGIKAQLDSIM
jgi:hypothetical protein